MEGPEHVAERDTPGVKPLALGRQATVTIGVTVGADGANVGASELLYAVSGCLVVEALGRIVLTVPAAAWAVRKVQSSHQLHGVLIGVVVAVTGFVMGFTMSLQAIAVFALTVGAGWLGGAMAARHRRKQDGGHPTR